MVSARNANQPLGAHIYLQARSARTAVEVRLTKAGVEFPQRLGKSLVGRHFVAHMWPLPRSKRVSGGRF